ncbi:MAG: hypothetical protein PWR20_1466 [Bacteroidales bacterium]|nr:hypothetical protein [Bacteroidales bacterium]MDN5330255.1 hypothetical protein [Bacteroidales bacterium]
MWFGYLYVVFYKNSNKFILLGCEISKKSVKRLVFSPPWQFGNFFYFCTVISMTDGVTAAQEILVLLVQVRILVGQHPAGLCAGFFIFLLSIIIRQVVIY